MNKYSIQWNSIWLIVCGVLAVLVIYALPALLLPYNLDSLNDEGFLFLNLRRAMSGGVSGGSQWASLSAAFLPECATNNIFALRVVGYLMNLVVCLFFSVCAIVFMRANGKLQSASTTVAFVFSSTLLFAQCANDLVAAYNQWQTLWLVSAISVFLLQEAVELNKRPICFFAVGFLLMMAFFTVLPSAIMVGGALCVLTLIKNWQSPKSLLLYYLLLALGAGLSVLVVHFFVAPINEIMAAMTETAQTITKLNRGYDPLSFATKILLYFRDYIMQMCMMLGASAVSYVLYKKGCKWSAAILLMVLLLVFWKYQTKPVFSFSTVCTLPIVWIVIQSTMVDGFHVGDFLRSYNSYLYMFLFFAPLLCIIGTNVYLGARMEYYIGIWTVLLFAIDKPELTPNKLALLMICLTMSFLPKAHDYHCARKTQSCNSNSPVLRHMYITPRYADYLDCVHEILMSRGYQKGDTIWSTQLDMMVLAAEEATPEGLYFQPMDFVSRRNIGSVAPRFLFINDFDIQIAGDVLFQWGLAEDYDIHHFESPENKKTDYPTDRYLYVMRIDSDN